MNKSWNKLASWILEDKWNRDQKKGELTKFRHPTPTSQEFWLEILPKAWTPQQTREAFCLPTLLGTWGWEEGPALPPDLAEGQQGWG